MRLNIGTWLFTAHTVRACLLLLAFFHSSLLAAPVYTVSRSVIDNGGGVSSSSNFTVYSSMGQSAAGAVSSSNYSLYAGFISIADTDGDSVLDNTDNCVYQSNLLQLNFDADLSGDACDHDDDNDGLDDSVEASLGTDTLNSDSDFDGLSDFYEVNMDGVPSSYQAGVDTNPNNRDSDGDGLDDGIDPEPLIPLHLADGDLAPYGNPDGVINAADLLIAQRIALGIITPTPQDLSHGDLYPPGVPDGVINISDLILIQQLVFSQP